MEQVLRTVSALNDAGFSQITMYETLLRNMDITSYAPPKSLDETIHKLKDSAVKREERRVRQIEASRLAYEKKLLEKEIESGDLGEKRKRDEEAAEELEEAPAEKRSRPEELTEQPNPPPPAVVEEAPKSPPQRISLAKPFIEQRGHTSYLTFAVLLPSIYPGSQSPGDAEH